MSSSSISKSSNSVGWICTFLSLLITDSSMVFTEIFPSPISLSDITVFLSSFSGTNGLSPALSCDALSLANSTKSY